MLAIASGGAMAYAQTSLVRVREGETQAAVAMALIEDPHGVIATTDSLGQARLPALEYPASLRIRRTGYLTMDIVAASSETIDVVLVRSPIPLPPVDVVEQRGPPALWQNAAVVCSTSAGDEDIAAVLARTPGIEVETVGGGVMVAIRGTSSAGTEAWLDGMPLSQGRFGGADLGGILPGVLEQLSVYQGWSPLALGGGALGGGVALETVSRPTQQGLRVRLGGGSLGRTEAGLGAAIPLPTGWAWAGVEGFMQDNGFLYLDDNATPLNDADDTLRTRDNNRVAVINVLLKASLGRDQACQWALTSLTSGRREGVPGPGADPIRDASHENWAQRAVLRHVRMVPAGWDLTTVGFLEWSASTVKDPSAELSHLVTTTTNAGWGAGGRLHARRQERTLRPEARLDIRAERFRVTSGAGQRRQERITASQAIGLAWHPLPWLRGKVEGGLLAYRDRDESADNRHEVNTARMAWAMEMPRGMALLLSAGVQGRAPTLVERFGDAGSVRGNAGLLPERALQAEAVLTAWDGALRIVGYRRTVTDLIHFWLRSPKVVIPENVGEARMAGVELIARLRPAGSMSVVLDGALQRTEDRSQAPYYRGNRLPGWPEWTAGAAAVGRMGERWTVSLEGRGRGEVFVDRANRRCSDATLGVGAFAQVRLLRTLLFVVAGENLSDQKGFDRWGYPEPGRRWRARVSYQF